MKMKPVKKIFRKSNIFSFLLGAIIFSGITGVAAYTILANDIGFTPKNNSWKVDNVSDAIDDLYTKANTYKNLTITTTATSDDILNGKTAYNNNGELITGISNKKYTETEYQNYANTKYNEGRISSNSMFADATGSYNATAAGSVNFNIGFKPKILIVTLVNTTTNENTAILYYNENRSSTKTYSFTYSNNLENEFTFNGSNPGMHIKNITNSGFEFNFSKGDRAIYYSAYK